MLVLDTDLVSVLLRGPVAEQAHLVDWLSVAEDRAVAVTIVTFEEQMRGWMARVSRAKLPHQQVPSYLQLRVLVESYQDLPILDFDEAAADRFVEYRRRYRRHGAQDLKIAAIVVTEGATLLSRNVRDFESIEGLDVQNPLRK